MFEIIKLILAVMLLRLSLADKYEKGLISQLMTGYDKRVRPSTNTTHAIPVTFGLALAQIIDVDEKNQIITTNCWITETWVDNSLTWDPKEYDDVDTILLPFDSVWLPDIVLLNRADVSSKLMRGSTNVIVTSKGNVTWMSTVIYKSSCTIDVRYFPFDDQNCSMVFASWSYDGSRLVPTLVDKKADLSNFQLNSEFELVDMHVEKNIVYYSCCVQPYPDITYYIHLKRRPMFYVCNMLLPCFLITLIALLGFCMPPDSGEKVAMGITTLLSMTVFLMLVTEAMPPTSDSLPLIGVYYFTAIGIVSLATALTVCTLNIHHKGFQGKSAPRWMKFVCFRILAPALCLKIQLPTSSKNATVFFSDKKIFHLNSPFKKRPAQLNCSKEIGEKLSRYETHDSLCQPDGTITDSWAYQPMDSERKAKTERLEDVERNFFLILKTMENLMEQNEERVAVSEHRDIIIKEWQQIALVVDRLLLLAFILLTIGVTLGLLLRGTISYALDHQSVY